MIWWSLEGFWKVVCLPTWTEASSTVRCSGAPQLLMKFFRALPMHSLLDFGMWRTASNPDLWLKIWQPTFRVSDFFLKHNVSVANPAFDLLPRHCLSALCRRLRGRIADLVPFWWVAFDVALAWSMPIANLSANTSAETSLCRLLDAQNCLKGMSSKVASHSDPATWEFTLLGLADQMAQGQSSIEFFPRNFPGLDDNVLNDDVLRET